MSGDSSSESLDGQYSDNHSAQETGNESEEYSDNEGGHCMYGNEPEYTTEEMRLLNIESDNEDSEEETNELDSSRLENLHWCSCLNCTVMPTFAESVCCREFADTLGDKLSGKKCITENTHFEAVCLNPDVLETAFIQIRRYNKKSSDIKKMNNK